MQGDFDENTSTIISSFLFLSSSLVAIAMINGQLIDCIVERYYFYGTLLHPNIDLQSRHGST